MSFADDLFKMGVDMAQRHKQAQNAQESLLGAISGIHRKPDVEIWWDQVRSNPAWCNRRAPNEPWEKLPSYTQRDLCAIYQAAIYPTEDQVDDADLRDQAVRLTMHPWERGITPIEAH